MKEPKKNFKLSQAAIPLHQVYILSHLLLCSPFLNIFHDKWANLNRLSIFSCFRVRNLTSLVALALA